MENLRHLQKQNIRRHLSLVHLQHLSGRAVIGGGFNTSYDTTIDFLQIGTTGNATDFGDLSINKGETGCISSLLNSLVWRKYINIYKCDQHNRLCSLCNTW